MLQYKRLRYVGKTYLRTFVEKDGRDNSGTADADLDYISFDFDDDERVILLDISRALLFR